MADDKKTKAAKPARTYKVRLGAQANFFYDPHTGIKVLKNKVIELTARQYQAKKIRAALNSGYLALVSDENEVPAKDESKVETNKEKFEALLKAGATTKKIADSFTQEAIKDLAEEYEVEPEEKDTKEEIVKVIIETIEENKQ